ncbi:hypothetical protein ACHAWF_007995, partial [Thalassiosira exigua]
MNHFGGDNDSLSAGPAAAESDDFDDNSEEEEEEEQQQGEEHDDNGQHLAAGSDEEEEESGEGSGEEESEEEEEEGGGGGGGSSNNNGGAMDFHAAQQFGYQGAHPPALPPMHAQSNPVAQQQQQMHLLQMQQQRGFQVSETRRKNASGALVCMAVGCERNAQANAAIEGNPGQRFCRAHYNSYLIATGRIDSWDCVCGNKVSVEQARCGACHRWNREGREEWRRTHGHNTASSPSKRRKGSKGASDYQQIRTYVPPDAGVRISAIRETNDKGRPLCKVVGCGKLDQSKNDGFCRMHFNMFAVSDGQSGGAGGGDSSEPWNCGCGHIMDAGKKRCGKCNRWKGGKRDPYDTKPRPVKKPRKTQAPTLTPASRSFGKQGDQDVGNWMCTCGRELPASKSRCGSCHRWRGGKRKGGWKIKPKAEGGSEVTTGSGKKGGRSRRSSGGAQGPATGWTGEWSCCGEVLPAKKTRCGKCHGWRGGKRVPKNTPPGSSGAGAGPATGPMPSWECGRCRIINPGSRSKCAGCEQWKRVVCPADNVTTTSMVVQRVGGMAQAGQGQGVSGMVPIGMGGAGLG